MSLQSSLRRVEHIEIISATKIHNNRPTAILGAPPDLDGGGGGGVVTGDISIHVPSQYYGEHCITVSLLSH